MRAGRRVSTARGAFLPDPASADLDRFAQTCVYSREHSVQHQPLFCTSRHVSVSAKKRRKEARTATCLHLAQDAHGLDRVLLASRLCALPNQRKCSEDGKVCEGTHSAPRATRSA